MPVSGENGSTSPDNQWAWQDIRDASEIGGCAGLLQAASPFQRGIPGLLALVAGEFADDVAEIWTGQRLAEYLLAPDRQRHVWHSWLASDRDDLTGGHSAASVRACQHLTLTKARDLMTEAYGCCPPGLIAALAKCGTRARARDFYRALVLALGRQDLGAKRLRHSASLSDALVFSLVALPTHLQSKPLFNALRTGAVYLEDFANLCWTVARLEALDVPGGIEGVITAAKPVEACRKALATLPFPLAPWRGSRRIRPLASRESLKDAGARLNNCLASGNAIDLTLSVVRGRSYCYEWLGDEPGVLQFATVPPLGWHLEQGRGRANRKLSAATWKAIEADLNDWPELAPVWIDGDGDAVGGSLFPGIIS